MAYSKDPFPKNYDFQAGFAGVYSEKKECLPAFNRAFCVSQFDEFGMKTTQIVIVGGGFAGLSLAKKLVEQPELQVTLVDKNNYHFFPPLIYQVATAFIEPSNIAYPFRRMFQERRNFHFHMGSLQRVFPDQKRIQTDSGVLVYDVLVLAMGTTTNFFGLENVQKNALPLKTIDEALRVRNHILSRAERAAHLSNPEERLQNLNIVIAGAGPTGVEMAGMLAEMGQRIGRKEYPEFHGLRPGIYLVDAGPAVLASMSTKAQTEAKESLERLGVHILLNTSVRDYVNGAVVLSSGLEIPTTNLIWASGVTVPRVEGIPAESVGRGGRIGVNAHNQVLGMEDVYAIGDVCLQETDPGYLHGHPQVAQVALQQADLLALNLTRKRKGQSLLPFHYRNKGSMAIISKYRAVVDLPGKGFFRRHLAWFVWLFIHILPLAGFRNKVQLAFNWFWSFVTNDPVLRLIIRNRE